MEAASLIGRYYAMDRDQRWERIKAYDLLIHGKVRPAITSSLKSVHDEGVTDELSNHFTKTI